MLARGDRRGFVVVDKLTNVHSLTRYVKGHKASAIKKRLAPLTPDDLPTVDEAKQIVRASKQAQDEGEGEKHKQAAEQRRKRAIDALAARHAQARAVLLAKEQELLTRHQTERLSLDAAQKSESAGILFRVRSAVADLIGKTPGLRSVLSHIQKLTHLDPKKRHQLESDALARRHAREKKDFERGKRFQARIETRERQALEKALRRKVGQDAKAEQSAEALAQAGTKAEQDFYDAARNQGLWKAQEFEDGDMSVEFNDAAEFTEGTDRVGEDGGDDLAPDWIDEADPCARSHRPRRGGKPCQQQFVSAPSTSFRARRRLSAWFR